jgi:Lipocalin-like domain
VSEILSSKEENAMNRRHILSLSVLAALGLALLPGSAPAQQKSLKEQLTGTWIIVSNDSTAADGKKSQLFGPKPKGILVLDATGQYSQTIVHPDVAHFKINNRQQGTPAENTAAVRGTTATFGTWTVDEASKTITVRNVGGMFPNQAGTDSKRLVVSVTADALTLTNPLTASGMRSDNVWRRAK